MKRSVQEIVELLVFGLIALLIGTGLLWLAGWVFDLAGALFKFFAALIWSLLRFIVPVAVGAAIVYALVRLIQQQREKSLAKRSAAAGDATSGEPPAATSESNSVTPPPPAELPVQGASSEGESRPTASEVWVPPQPSPPTSSTETLEEPRPPEDSGPVDEVTPEAPQWEPLPAENRGPVDEVPPEASPWEPEPPEDRSIEATPEAARPEPTALDEDASGSVAPDEGEARVEEFGETTPQDGTSDEGDEDERRS